jgi:hypothetical protein
VIKISQEERPDGAPLLEEKERRHLLEIYSTGRLPLDFSLSTAMTHPPFHPPSKIHPIDEDLNRTRSDQIDFGESINPQGKPKEGRDRAHRLKAEKDRRDKEAKEKRKIGIE